MAGFAQKIACSFLCKTQTCPTESPGAFPLQKLLHVTLIPKDYKKECTIENPKQYLKQKQMYCLVLSGDTLKGKRPTLDTQCSPTSN